MSRVDKTIDVDAPIGSVYRFWANFGNFPRFMSHVKEVRGEGGHYHWIADAPLGVNVHWDAEVMEDVENDHISWRSTGGQLRNDGVVRFEELGPRRTRVHVSMYYHTPAGVVGDLVAKAFRRDPAHAIDDDMKRFKAMVEVSEASRVAP
jgi:uncharacterized membrane protein